MAAIDLILQQALQAAEGVTTLQALETLRVEFLGKKGHITQALKSLSELSTAERPQAGLLINAAKISLQDCLNQKRIYLEEQALKTKIQVERQDISLPGKGLEYGTLHPVTHTLARITQWFENLGFTVCEGPEIESDYYNFEALNIPAHHPARTMHDTFYLNSNSLLRTHTSPVQIRSMQNSTPPLRIITPGKVYRHDLDATHTPQFHQVEVLMVDKNINFGHLKSMLQNFLNAFFEQELEIRFRPSYFPFTEPSVEIDILRGDKGWLEVLGGGLVHPQVLENCGINSEEYTGLAFGLGVERLAMLYYNIPDIRLFVENDLRFLNQF